MTLEVYKSKKGEMLVIDMQTGFTASFKKGRWIENIAFDQQEIGDQMSLVGDQQALSIAYRARKALAPRQALNKKRRKQIAVKRAWTAGLNAAIAAGLYGIGALITVNTSFHNSLHQSGLGWLIPSTLRHASTSFELLILFASLILIAVPFVILFFFSPPSCPQCREKFVAPLYIVEPDVCPKCGFVLKEGIN